MKGSGFHRAALFAVLCGAAAACVDSPSAPATAADQNQLAASFDGLSADEAAVGDTERSEEFRWAALALRLGVSPTRFEVTNDGEKQVFEAFVHSVHWLLPAMSLRPATHRSFVAWRKTDTTMQVILISSAVDSAPVLHPYSMRLATPGGAPSSPVAGALAGYFERGSTSSAWIGVTGSAKVAETSSVGSCSGVSAANAPKGVTCQLIRYAVWFDVGFRKAMTTSNELASTPDTRRISAGEQSVAGVRLTFSCPAPTSAAGCR
jgi:hypothetical protein